jgi:hypothetical protein
VKKLILPKTVGFFSSTFKRWWGNL